MLAGIRDLITGAAVLTVRTASTKAAHHATTDSLRARLDAARQEITCLRAENATLESGRVLVVSDVPGERRALEGRRAGWARCWDAQVGHTSGPEDPVVFAVTGHRIASSWADGSKASPSGLATTTV